MSYDTLRRMILDACSFDEYAVFDDVYGTPESRRYAARIDAGENPRTVVREFAKQVVDGRTWTVKVNGESYQVRMTSRFKGEVASKIPVKLPDYASNRRRKKILGIAKRTLVCLANLEEILASGKYSRPIPNDDRMKVSGIAHQGWHWIYVKDISREAGAKGKVLVQIALTNYELDKKQPPNNIYNVVSEGNLNFAKRMSQFKKHAAAKGEVVITLEE